VSFTAATITFTAVNYVGFAADDSVSL
jgi:hypothetical protein